MSRRTETDLKILCGKKIKKTFKAKFSVNIQHDNNQTKGTNYFLRGAKENRHQGRSIERKTIIWKHLQNLLNVQHLKLSVFNNP